MTKTEVLTQLEKRGEEWDQQYRPVVDECLNYPSVESRMTYLLVMINRQFALGGETVAYAQVLDALAAASASGFTLGLTMGLLIDGSNEPKTLLVTGREKENCNVCLGTGEICIACGLARYECDCSIGGYSPVKCHVCDGEGLV